jgi:hypothetical protein
MEPETFNHQTTQLPDLFVWIYFEKSTQITRGMSPIPGTDPTYDLSDQRAFVWNIFFKSTRITRNPLQKRIPRFSLHPSFLLLLSASTCTKPVEVSAFSASYRARQPQVAIAHTCTALPKVLALFQGVRCTLALAGSARGAQVRRRHESPTLTIHHSLFTIPYSPFPIHHSPFTMIPVVNTSFHTISPACANLHKKCNLPKGKMHINRGSNPPPYLPSPFLSFIKTPWAGMSMKNPPSTDCLNIIEPLFEPPTARGRLFPPPSAKLASSQHRLHLHRTAYGAVQVCRRHKSPTPSTRPSTMNYSLLSIPQFPWDIIENGSNKEITS